MANTEKSALEDCEQARKVMARMLAESEAQKLELLEALKELRKQSESFVNLSRQRGEDLRPEAADRIRNAIALAREAIDRAEGWRP
jgi:hypothetical protein